MIERKPISFYIYGSMVEAMQKAAERRRAEEAGLRRGGRPTGASTIGSEMFEAAWPLFQAAHLNARELGSLIEGLGGEQTGTAVPSATLLNAYKNNPVFKELIELVLLDEEVLQAARDAALAEVAKRAKQRR